MIPNQRKILTVTRRNSQTTLSQWRHQQQPKTKKDQSNGEISQRTGKYNFAAMKKRKWEDEEKLMFSNEEALLRFEAVSNHLVLKSIMAHMTPVTLIAARLVSKEWKKLADFELVSRQCGRLCPYWCWSELRLIMSSDVISWMEFDLKYLNVGQLNTFATHYGHQVKILRLPGWESAHDISPWRTAWSLLATGKFPNLEILRFCKLHLIERFSSIDWGPWPVECTSNPRTLPNLQRIEQFGLSDVSRLPPNFLQYKGHLVKSADLDILNCDCGIDPLTLITALAQAKPKLERLVIGDRRPEHGHGFDKQINLILEPSRESLRFLEISLSSASPFYFQSQPLQTYTKLSTLRLCINLTCFNLKNQLESLNQDCLPLLQTVSFEVNPWIKFDLPESPSFCPRKRDNTGRGVLTSVVNLEVKCKYQSGSTCVLIPSNWFPWLTACFPNVQNLTTVYWKDTDEIFRHVFTLWPKLTSFAIHFDFDPESDAKLDLDPVFTGLSLEKCQELKNNPEKMNMAKDDILKDRTWPNLTSLNELKRLDFILAGRHPYWSLVSFLYAINLRPELTTRIRCFSGSHDELEPFAPYAQLQHFTPNGWTSI